MLLRMQYKRDGVSFGEGRFYCIHCTYFYIRTKLHPNEVVYINQFTLLVLGGTPKKFYWFGISTQISRQLLRREQVVSRCGQLLLSIILRVLVWDALHLLFG